MKEIIVSGSNHPALIDEEDYPVLNRLKWSIDTTTGIPACGVTTIIPGKGYKILITRFLLPPQKRGGNIFNPIHIDGNKLNNCKSNLELRSKSRVSQNRKKMQNTTSKYVGVYKHSHANKWVAQISKMNTYKYLGIYSIEKEAAIAYDIAAYEMYGKNAKLNFPDTLT